MNSKITISAKQAAEYLGVSYWLVTKLAREGKIPHLRLGKKIFFRMETLNSHLSNLESVSVNLKL